MPIAVTLRDIQQARRRIASGIWLSPCQESHALSEMIGARVFCKLDNLQHTGSFKERGARNALLLMSREKRKRGVIAASAGNHALGLAYHGKLIGIPVTVVMPQSAPLIKSNACLQLGAHVILHGETFAAAKHEADRLCREQNLTYIHGFDDPAIIAGQGTMGLEILDQVPDVEAVVLPIGGGGLIAGVAVAVKTRRPKVRIIGVESAHWRGFSKALRFGHPVAVCGATTLADGLAVAQIGTNAFAIARSRVDEVVSVNEDQIALAILKTLETEKTVVEGAGATALAACLAGKLKHLRGKRLVVAFCGGNIDPNILGRVIEKGLVAEGRLIRFTATVSDRPGSLARLARLLADAGASVKDITHERAFADTDISGVNITCTVETRDHQHARAVQRQLIQNDIHICGNSS
jgi:threonine dehydratase